MKIKVDRSLSLGKLNAELNRALGKSVTLTRVGDTLTVIDPSGSVDKASVERIITHHVHEDPLTTPSMYENLVVALEAATTVAQLKAALLDVFRPMAERDTKGRERQRAIRERLGR